MRASHGVLTDSSEQWIAVLSVAALGCGAVLVLHGALSGQINAAAAGGSTASSLLRSHSPFPPFSETRGFESRRRPW